MLSKGHSTNIYLSHAPPNSIILTIFTLLHPGADTRYKPPIIHMYGRKNKKKMAQPVALWMEPSVVVLHHTSSISKMLIFCFKNLSKKLMWPWYQKPAKFDQQWQQSWQSSSQYFRARPSLFPSAFAGPQNLLLIYYGTHLITYLTHAH